MLLSNFGFSHLDELDMELYRGIANGYFTQEAINAHASEFNQMVLKKKSIERHRQAWLVYHYSFKGGLDVLEGIANSFIQEAEFLSASNMNGVVSLLRELGLNHKIAPVIDAFISTHHNDPEALDPSRMYLRNEVADVEVIERLNAVRKQKESKRRIEEILSVDADLYNQNVVTELLSFSVDDYERILLECEGEKFEEVMRGLQAYSRISNPSEDMIEITRRYHSAMRKIAETSDLNRHRVIRWGINPVEQEEAAPITQG